MKCDKRMKVLEIATGILVLRTVFLPACRACGGIMDASKYYFHSPNYGSEYGKKETCTWVFDLTDGRALELKMGNFKLYYIDDNNTKQCGDSYRLVINGETVNCTQNVPQENSQYRLFFYNNESPSCAKFRCDDPCKRYKIESMSVKVEYHTDGSKPQPRLEAHVFRGFRMYFYFRDCPQGRNDYVTTYTSPSTTSTLAAATTTTPTSSLATATTTGRIALKVEKPSGNVVVYVAISGGLVLLLLVVIAGFFILRKRKLLKSGKSQSGVNGNAEGAEMSSNILYGTAQDLVRTGHASMNSADVYAEVDSSAKGEKATYAEINTVGKVDSENKNQSEEGPHATPTINTMTYAAVRIHEDGEKSTFHFDKDSA